MMLLTLLLTPRSLAQPADFSGKWVLDEQRSMTMEPILTLQGVPWAMRKLAEGLDAEVIITQSIDRMTVTFDNLRCTCQQDLVFDGLPHPTVNPAGLPITMSTSWEGSVVVSSGPLEAGGQPAILTEHRSLSGDGQSMTVQVQLERPGGQAASTRRVYRKQ